MDLNDIEDFKSKITELSSIFATFERQIYQKFAPKKVLENSGKINLQGKRLSDLFVEINDICDVLTLDAKKTLTKLAALRHLKNKAEVMTQKSSEKATGGNESIMEIESDVKDNKFNVILTNELCRYEDMKRKFDKFSSKVSGLDIIKPSSDVESSSIED